MRKRDGCAKTSRGARLCALILQSNEEGKKQILWTGAIKKIGMDCIRAECKDEDLDIKALQARSRRGKIFVKELNAHDKEFLSPPSMKMATEYVIYFFLVYTRFFAFLRDYTPIFGKYFHGKNS